MHNASAITYKVSKIVQYYMLTLLCLTDNTGGKHGAMGARTRMGE
jgi:hypothetical protein